MRIACIYLPQFPLQIAQRQDPGLRGRPVLIAGLGARGAGPVVIACSRAAHALGVRIGMAVTAARALADQVQVVAVEADALAGAADAVAEVLLAQVERVDRGGPPHGSHHAAYAEVPLGCRGATFGARAVAELERAGWVARVGIADDRFTAWVAASRASEEAPVMSVPRGGAAAFLAPMPLGLLSISPEVQHVLGALGVTTLGQFAALPPPSVARAWDADYQALARGEGGDQLNVFVPRGEAHESVVVSPEHGLGAAVEALAARVAGRLQARRTGAGVPAVRVAFTSPTAAGEPRTTHVPLTLDGATTADALVEAMAAALRQHEAEHVSALTVSVTEAPTVSRATPIAAASAWGLAGGTAVTAASPDAADDDDRFVLTSPLTTAMVRTPHRRTRRGKQRPRLRPASQARLF